MLCVTKFVGTGNKYCLVKIPGRSIILLMAKTINDKLKDFIVWAIECYDVASYPPAVNYSKHVDPSYRDDVNGYSRAYLLRLSIDAKQALNGLLDNLPRNRADVLLGWITSTESYYWHNLTYKQQELLNRDRKTLKNRLMGKKTPQRTQRIGVSLILKALDQERLTS
jgi:hypothetical protein